MKTQFTVQIKNDKAHQFFSILQDNEYFNFDEEIGDFWTSFIFTNLTPEEINTILQLTETLK